MARYFTDEHEWIDLEGDLATVGITDYAQDQLGDIVFVELPDVGSNVEKGGEAAVVEDDPALVNTSPEEEGWFFRITVADKSELEGLMDAKAYKAFCDEL